MAHQLAAIAQNYQMVASGGTAEALMSTETLVRWVEIMAKKLAAANTGNVHIGVVGLAAGSAECMELTPGSSYFLPPIPDVIYDLAAIYVDADTDDDGVTFLYCPV